MIGPRDRVAAVLARDERLVETFAALSPAFARLRSPAMRRVMARLVTVEQAARMAGVAPERLVAELNRALDGGDVPPQGAPHGEETRMTETETTLPAALAGLPPERVHDLDVRDDLRGGREPFSRIMEARRALPAGDVLRLRATFEPVPLYAVMAKQGLEHWTERLADDDWRVWFHGTAPRSEAAAPGAGGGEVPASGSVPGGPGVVVLDVRGLEPPEPMVRTLEALDALPPGATLLQINQRVPRFLLPELEARGFRHEVREQSDDLVRIFIRRAE